MAWVAQRNPDGTVSLVNRTQPTAAQRTAAIAATQRAAAARAAAARPATGWGVTGRTAGGTVSLGATVQRTAAQRAAASAAAVRAATAARAQARAQASAGGHSLGIVDYTPGGTITLGRGPRVRPWYSSGGSGPGGEGYDPAGQGQSLSSGLSGRLAFTAEPSAGFGSHDHGHGGVTPSGVTPSGMPHIAGGGYSAGGQPVPLNSPADVGAFEAFTTGSQFNWSNALNEPSGGSTVGATGGGIQHDPRGGGYQEGGGWGPNK